MKRCFFVLLLAMLGTQTIPVSGTAVATSTGRRTEESNLVVPSAAMLAWCPKTCGNLSFAYPFGIGSGCFRDAEFNLTCVDGGAGGTSRLLFGDGITEVIDRDTSMPSGIDVGWTQSISIAYNTTVPVVSGVDVYNMSSWSPPGRSFVLFEANINVMACGFDVYLLNHDTGNTRNVCSATCPGREITETTALQNCNGTWCCSVPFLLNSLGFRFSFVRRRGEDDSRVVHHSSPLWNKISVTMDDASLQWSVLDQPRCADAQGEAATYACISNHSSCNDNPWTNGGYQCYCNGGYIGNPYVLGGCSRDKVGYNPIQRVTNCTRRCGNIEIPFPFGIEEGCFARKVFQLNCTNVTTSALQMGDDEHQVMHINIDEGLVDIKYIASYHLDFLSIYIDEEPDLYMGSWDTSSAQWAVANLTCQEAQMDTSRYACVSNNSKCLVVNSTMNGFYGYRCKCSSGFQGNPYVQKGCQDIDECKTRRGICKGVCHNTVGSYSCSKCPDKTDYDTTTMQCNSTKRQNIFLGALSYLHSAASISVFHRDVKSSNILLDGNYTAKVADFGALRLVSIDQTHIVTNVQGTFGYLDPEYYYTRQLNEKSDVYSFGVVLIELLLRKEPILTSESGSKQNLSNYFLWGLKGRPVTEIVAVQVLDEATEEEISSVASLAEMCLRLRGEDRPTMKQVEMVLPVLQTERIKRCHVDQGNGQEKEPFLTPGDRGDCFDQLVAADFSASANLHSENVRKCYSFEQEFMSNAGATC